MIKKLFSIFLLLFNVFVVFANTTPILSNFRVEATHPSRVYFDSSEPIAGSNVQGFTISGKTISGVSIAASQNAGHYFTVTSAFTFWDNNTIRYEGGGNITSEDGTAPLEEFTLSYIVNTIPEPDAPISRYVTNSATGGGDGLSEATAWTLQEAFDNAGPGQTVWMKAGDYGDQNFQITVNGTISNPVKFIGYKNSPGDITDNYWGKGIAFSSAEMPTITGTFSDNNYGRGIYWISSNYVVFRNFQLTKYYHGMHSGPNDYQANSNLIFDRVNGYDFDKPGVWDSHSGAFSFNSDLEGNTNIRFLNSVIKEYEMLGLSLYGDGFCLIDNVQIYHTNNDVKPDYQININGHNNIVRNSHVEIIGDYYSPSTHGIGIRGDSQLSNTYNLIEKSTALNLNEGFFIRNNGCDYNVIKDCYVGNNGVVNNHYRGGVFIWGGSDYNIVERLVVDDVVGGIIFKDNYEEDIVPEDFEIGRNNIIRNCTFNNVDYGISVEEQSSGGDGKLYDNKIINCTFNNVNTLFQYDTNVDVRNLDFINCTFSNVSKYNKGTTEGERFTNCNFWNFWLPNGDIVPGSENISVDPLFVNAAQNDFRLQKESQLIDKGLNVDEVKLDFDLNLRPQGDRQDIGAFESLAPKIGSVTPDTAICEGETLTLVAEGGDSYSWNTGETTASITVNPTDTATYTVTVTLAGDSDSHDVTVTVDTAPSVDAGTDQTICEGETVTLTATGNGDFLWSTGETTESITVNPTTTTTYSVTASNACSTEASDDVVVTVNAAPNLNAGSDVAICQGESVTLTATGTGPFSWSTGETTASITVNPTATTIYTVVSDNGSCSETDEIEVEVNTPPAVTLGADQTICEGQSVTLTATGVGNFLWSTGATGASITVSPNTTTTYSVTASNSCSSDATDDIVITVNPSTNLDAGSDVSICQGESVTLTATGTGPFSWSTGETTASISVSPNNTTTYSVTSDNGSCSETDQVEVTVNVPPTVDAGDDKSICEGESVTLTATGNGDFLWSTGETTASITVSPNVTSTYSVTTTAQGCQSTAVDYVDVIVGESPNLSTTDDVTIQRGASVTLTATGNGDFSWNTGETTPTITVSPESTTSYTVTLTAEGGCTDKGTIVVTVVESADGGNFVAFAGEDTTICSGEEIVLTASGGESFLWNTGETTRSITVAPTESTIFSVQVSQEDYTDTAYVKVSVDGSCSQSSKEMVVYPIPTQGILNIDLLGYDQLTKLRVYDMNGNAVLQQNIKNTNGVTQLKHNIDLSRLARGVYFITLTNKGETDTKRIVLM